MSYDCDVKQSKYDAFDEDEDSEDEDDIAIEMIKQRFGRDRIRVKNDTEFMFEVDDDEEINNYGEDMDLENDDLLEFDLDQEGKKMR
jgi:hypothetical protein